MSKKDSGDGIKFVDTQLSNMSLIEAKSVSKSYGKVRALKHLDLDLDKGEIVGLIGPNGAGKSTGIKIVSGQVQRDSGDLEVLGIDPGKNPVKLREKVGILPEREDPPSFLKVKEYLEYVSEIRNEPINAEKWLERFNLEGKEEKLTVDLSKGERQKLMVIQAFFHEPELALIDEPLINLDPVIQEEVKELFRETRERDGAVLLSTHSISLAEDVCDRVYVLEDGKSRETGSDQLMQEFQ